MAHSMELKEQFVQLRAKGLSYEKITKEINVSKPTMIGWSREFKNEIYAAEYARAIDLMERCYLTRASALEKSAIELERVENAIVKKDLCSEKLPTLLSMRIEIEKNMSNMAQSTRRSFERCEYEQQG